MNPKDPLPLWLESIPDREPWRRGRDVICGLTILILLGEIILVARSILLGDLTNFFLTAGLGAVALLLLFFIWIGRNWPRWIIAPIFACVGFVDVIWGMREGDGPLFLLGLAALTIFTYLALAPSVYAFARHQRERISWRESAVVGAIFGLVIASVSCGLYGIYVYDLDLQNEAAQFAGTAFNKVFIFHDDEFLARNLKDEDRPLTPRAFVLRVGNELGQPRWIGKLRGVFTTRVVDRDLAVTGKFEVPVLFYGSLPIWVNIDVSRIGRGWQIDHIGWEYQPNSPEASP